MAKDLTGRIWARPASGLATPTKLFWHAFPGDTWKLADNTPFVAFCGRKFPFVNGWRTQGELVVLHEHKVCGTCLTRESRNQSEELIMTKDPTGNLWARGSKETTRTGGAPDLWHAFPVEYAGQQIESEPFKALCGKKLTRTSAWRSPSFIEANAPASRLCPACVRKA